jgi:glycine oxidase
MISRSSHVVVVGGGVVGCAIAFRLAQADVRVTLIERDPFGGHASGKNVGNLNPLFLAPPPLVPLALESYRLHFALAEELASLGCPRYALEPVRRILLAFDKTESAGFANVARLFEGRDAFSARLLDAPGLRALEPRLPDEAQAGVLIEGNMSLDAHALTNALADGSARLGATLARACVKQLQTESRRVTAVRTENGEIACDAVVLATGPWVAETSQWLGLSLPVTPMKGQMLRMSLPGEGLRFDLTHGPTSLYRRGKNEVWVGATQEEAGMDETPTAEARQQLQREAVRIMPEMARAVLLEHAAALRPMTPSGLPIVEQAAGWDNVFVANGGGMKGVLLCTGIAGAIRDLMLTGHTALPLNFQIS